MEDILTGKIEKLIEGFEEDSNKLKESIETNSKENNIEGLIDTTPINNLAKGYIAKTVDAVKDGRKELINRYKDDIRKQITDMEEGVVEYNEEKMTELQESYEFMVDVENGKFLAKPNYEDIINYVKNNKQLVSKFTDMSIHRKREHLKKFNSKLIEANNAISMRHAFNKGLGLCELILKKFFKETKELIKIENPNIVDEIKASLTQVVEEEREGIANNIINQMTEGVLFTVLNYSYTVFDKRKRFEFLDVLSDRKLSNEEREMIRRIIKEV